MGTIRLFDVCLVMACVLMFLSGCTPSQKKQNIEKSSVKQETQQVMISTGTRILPDSCSPGGIITVRINVIPANQISGVIITEKIPEGWELVKSDPQFSRIEQNSVYKWLQWSQQVAPFTIVYQLRIPETAKGKFVFEGKLTTLREGDVPIAGDIEITVK